MALFKTSSFYRFSHLARRRCLTGLILRDGPKPTHLFLIATAQQKSSAGAPQRQGPPEFIDKMDDAPAKLRVLDPHEGSGQRQPVGRGKNRTRGLVTELRPCLCADPALKHPFEEEQHRDLEDAGQLLQPARANAIDALLILLHLMGRTPSASPSVSWLMPSIIRRMRTRLPTCCRSD